MSEPQMSGNKRRGNVQLYGWEWDRDQERRPRIPWIGVFLLVFGGLLLLERALPAYRDLGNIAVLAAGGPVPLSLAGPPPPVPPFAAAPLAAAAAPGGGPG